MNEEEDDEDVVAEAEEGKKIRRAHAFPAVVRPPARPPAYLPTCKNNNRPTDRPASRYFPLCHSGLFILPQLLLLLFARRLSCLLFMWTDWLLSVDRQIGDQP